MNLEIVTSEMRRAWGRYRREENAYRVLMGKLEDPVEDLRIDRRILLKQILKKLGCQGVGWVNRTRTIKRVLEKHFKIKPV
jgi:hypothetical protein